MLALLKRHLGYDIPAEHCPAALARDLVLAIGMTVWLYSAAEIMQKEDAYG
jgi:hypothetical protein